MSVRVAIRIPAAVAAAGAVSFTYQRIEEARDCRRFPPPGRLVDIGGRCLHQETAGEGSPTVVIIPALADNVLQWLPILEGVAAETQACVYDRAGIGWSDPPPRARRASELMAADLHALLCAAGVAPPYVLAGHSIGGVIARRFYAQHPADVAGIVLIESSHEQQALKIAAADWRMGASRYVFEAARRQVRPLGGRRLAASLGLVRGFDAMIDREAPHGYRDANRAIVLSSRKRRVAVRELLMVARGLGRPPSLGSAPLTVLTRPRWEWRGWPIWAQLQDELAALSTDSLHIHAERGGHYLQLDEPDLVIQVIRGLVRRCRAAASLREG